MLAGQDGRGDRNAACCGAGGNQRAAWTGMKIDCKGGKMVKLKLIIEVLVVIGVLDGTIAGVQAQSDDEVVRDRNDFKK